MEIRDELPTLDTWRIKILEEGEVRKANGEINKDVMFAKSSKSDSARRVSDTNGRDDHNNHNFKDWSKGRGSHYSRGRSKYFSEKKDSVDKNEI